MTHTTVFSVIDGVSERAHVAPGDMAAYFGRPPTDALYHFGCYYDEVLEQTVGVTTYTWPEGVMVISRSFAYGDVTADPPEAAARAIAAAKEHAAKIRQTGVFGPPA